MAAVPKIDLSKVLTDEDQVPELGLGIDASTKMQQLLTSTSRNVRRDVATQALYSTSSRRAAESTLRYTQRSQSVPTSLSLTSGEIVHEQSNLPDPVSAPIFSPKRYAARPEEWQSVGTYFEKTQRLHNTPSTIKETDASQLDFRSQGSTHGVVPGYSGHINATLRQSPPDTMAREISTRQLPQPPIESAHNHVNMVGYSGFVPTSLFNSEYSRYARAAPEDLTSTARTHRTMSQGLDQTSRAFPRSTSLSKEVVLSYPFNPYNNKIGSAVTGTIHQSYRETRKVHPLVGPSGIKN